MAVSGGVLYPYNDYTTEFTLERAGVTAGSYIPATGVVLRARLARDPNNGTVAAHATLDVLLVEVSPACYQGAYDGGDIAAGFPETLTGVSVDAWEIVYSSQDLRAVRKVKLKPFRVLR